MWDLPNKDVTRWNVPALNLGVASETEIIVAFDEQLPIDRTMRSMANGAAFPQSFVLENERAGLLPVALGATLVEAGHRQPSRGFHDFMPMRIVALRAIHAPFHYRMAMR